MAVIKVEKTKNYTVMSNFHLRDKKISLKAKGLLSYILSLPPSKQIRKSHLASDLKEGKDAIDTAINELVELGYATKSDAYYDDKSKLTNDYVFYEMSIKTYAENPTSTYAENPHIYNKSSKEDYTDVNTGEESTSTSQYSEDYYNDSTEDSLKAEFMIIWGMYPTKKMNILDCLREYKHHRKDGVSFEEIKSGMEHFAEYVQKHNPEPMRLKNSLTWFLKQGWHDRHFEETKQTSRIEEFSANGGIIYD